jgi:hypothetical protein
MGMSAENKAAASARMKALHATGKLKHRTIPLPPLTPKAGKPWSIVVAVDWETLEILEAQQAYSTLKKEFERAGFVMNQRSMPVPGSYVCFICKKKHLGDPRGKDYSYVNPKTGLMQVVEICGELCWLNYQKLRIEERKEREMPTQNV